MATITSNPVPLSETWGAKFCDYTMSGKRVDFQDLMVAVAEKRATSVEGEVNPLTTRIRARNGALDRLGAALADLTREQASFKSDAAGDARSSLRISEDTYSTLLNTFRSLNFSDRYMLKREVEEWIQRVKSKIDSLNNESQTDMSRLQSLVDRRDESYSTATNLMSAISDTRSNLIRNF